LILVDTSAWVEYFRGTSSDTHLRVTDLVTSDEVAVCEPVVMEVLMGARDAANEQRLRGALRTFVLLPFHASIDLEAAAQIYRTCRSSGVTPRSIVDCMIASVAIRHHAAVLARDTDFARIAEVVPLKLDPATPGAV
jgi:predicted nucleic acid-binding protein